MIDNGHDEHVLAYYTARLAAIKPEPKPAVRPSSYKLRPRCKRGHPFTESNTRIVKLSEGYTARQCKQCRAQKDNLRYRTNPLYRAAIRARAMTRLIESRTI